MHLSGGCCGSPGHMMRAEEEEDLRSEVKNKPLGLGESSGLGWGKSEGGQGGAWGSAGGSEEQKRLKPEAEQSESRCG